MIQIVGFFLDNFLLIGFIVFCIYIYKLYIELKKQTEDINALFSKTLDKYLETKIQEAKLIIDNILNEYGHVEAIKAEINRLSLMIEKGTNGTINDKVDTSNAINKFKLSKKIDLEKYPKLTELKKIGTFKEEDLESLDNGIAIARREFNSKVFKYNEIANGFPMQYLTKYLKLNSQFIIFEQSKSKKYEEIYEVFEENEPEIDSLSVLNRTSNEENLNDLIFNKHKKEDIKNNKEQ